MSRLAQQLSNKLCPEHPCLHHTRSTFLSGTSKRLWPKLNLSLEEKSPASAALASSGLPPAANHRTASLLSPRACARVFNSKTSQPVQLFWPRRLVEWQKFTFLARDVLVICNLGFCLEAGRPGEEESRRRRQLDTIKDFDGITE